MNRVAHLYQGEVSIRDAGLAPLAPSQVRVRVARAGINFWEVMQRRGAVPIGEPAVLGTEGAGVVVEVGDAVHRLSLGDRVAWSKVRGSFAESVVGEESQFAIVPDGVDDATAAGLLFQGITAHYLANDAWPLQRGDVAAVTAAAGGVGLLLTQLLVSRGVRVIGIVSAEEKLPVTLDAGAEAALLYGPELDQQVSAQAAPDALAAIYDSVGGEVAEKLVPTLRTRGAMVLYGAASGAEAQIPTRSLASGSFFLTRTAGVHYTRTDAEWAARAHSLIALAESGGVAVRSGGEWPLHEVDEALDALESRRTVGKLFVVP